MAEPMRVASTIIYLRTSTEEQNPENQLADCQRINFYGDAEIIEDKQSAWKDNKERTGFEMMKKKIIAGHVSHLIIWDFDRLFRNRIKFKEFLELLKAYKVKLHSVRQQWMEDLNKVPDPWGQIVYEMLINVFGWMAEEESKKKSERVKIAHANHKGKNWGRPGIPENTRLEVVKLYRSGKSMREISKLVSYWDKSRHLKKISIGAVHKIIANLPEEKASPQPISSKIPFLNASRSLKGGDDHGKRTRV